MHRKNKQMWNHLQFLNRKQMDSVIIKTKYTVSAEEMLVDKAQLLTLIQK
jgi:catalase (peroxidase I)